MKAKRHGSGAAEALRPCAALRRPAQSLKCGGSAREEQPAPKDEAAASDTPSSAPSDSVYIGKSVKPEFILLRLANRHGLVTGIGYRLAITY